MSDRFIKATREIKNVHKQPHYTNEPGDILIQKLEKNKPNQAFIRLEDQYHCLTDNIKTINGGLKKPNLITGDVSGIVTSLNGQQPDVNGNIEDYDIQLLRVEYNPTNKKVNVIFLTDAPDNRVDSIFGAAIFDSPSKIKFPENSTTLAKSVKDPNYPNVDVRRYELDTTPGERYVVVFAKKSQRPALLNFVKVSATTAKLVY